MKILMVCLGNICRSPLAEGIMKKMAEENGLNWEIDSAGTGGYHQGDLPDSRSVEEAAKHGIDITDQRARKFRKNDLQAYDLILAMDQQNYRDILMHAQSEEKEKVHLILNFTHPGENRAVPDPYYGGGFDHVYNMLHSACANVLTTYQ